LTVVGELCGPGTPTTVTGAGPDVDSYTHSQPVAATVWTIVHNLNRDVAVRVEDLAGVDVDPDDIATVDSDTVTVTFLAPQAGRAIIT
jgi:hypothetical protein